MRIYRRKLYVPSSKSGMSFFAVVGRAGDVAAFGFASAIVQAPRGLFG